MIKFIVRNHRGCKKADVELEKITLIAGENAQGKTSFLDAVRSVATGKPAPYKDVPKKIGSMLVSSGTASGYATIELDEYNHSRVDWPVCKYISTGKALQLSDLSVGIENLATMPKTNRINYILDSVKKDATKKSFIKELVNKKIFPTSADLENDESFKGLWDQLDVNGWDVVHKTVKAKGATLKGKWEQVTGEKWGVKKAPGWLPEGWQADLMEAKIETLEADIISCKEWLEAAIKDEAITESEIEKLKVLSSNIEEYKQAMYTLQTEYNKQDALKVKLQVERRSLDNNKGDILTCPGCNTEVLLKNSKLIKFTKEELNKIMSSINTITSEIIIVEKTATRLFNEYNEAKLKYNSAVQAAETLKSSTLNDAATETQEKIDEMRNKLIVAESRLTSKKANIDATRINDSINKNISLVKILSPEGLRLSLLKKALTIFNNSMLRLTDLAGWKPVEITEDCTITCNGVPYGRFLAKSELYRVEILLQIMCALYEKSEFVIIDNADELTESIRNGLFQILMSIDIKCIIATAVDKESLLQRDLLKKNGINSYWVNGGEVK